MIERVVRNDEVVGLIPIWSTSLRRAYGWQASYGTTGRGACDGFASNAIRDSIEEEIGAPASLSAPIAA